MLRRCAPSTSGASRASGMTSGGRCSGCAATWSWPTSPGIRRLASRMNSRQACGRRVGPGRRDRGPRPPPRDRPPAHRALRGGAPARARSRPRSTAWTRRSAGRRPPARPVRRGVPGPRPRAGAAAHRLEELLLTRVANENPAIGPLRELVDDRGLARGTRYGEAIAQPRVDASPTDRRSIGDGVSLLELMRMPARARADLAGRPAALHPRPGAAPRDEPRRAHPPARHRDRRPRRGGARAPPAVRGRRRWRCRRRAGASRRRSFGRPRPTSPRRSRRTRPGCRRSC